MSKRYIISLMAANRVGILSAVTQALDDLGANLLEVSQTVMQKYFTIILAADFPDERDPKVIVDHIRDACSQYGVQVNLKIPDEELLQNEQNIQTDQYFLTITGYDQKGTAQVGEHTYALTYAWQGLRSSDVATKRQYDSNRVLNWTIRLIAEQRGRDPQGDGNLCEGGGDHGQQQDGGGNGSGAHQDPPVIIRDRCAKHRWNDKTRRSREMAIRSLHATT